MTTRKLTAIDLFAGAGGFSAGAGMAGIRVLWAANHWPIAVQTHSQNHPGASHVCQDLHQADWSKVPRHDILLASPCCQGHSRARGRAGREGAVVDESRATAWAVVSAAEFHRPRFLVIENVAEFLTWALYPAWKQAIRLLGYTISESVLNAADFGVPQSRERVFIVGSLDGPVSIKSPNRPHVAARTIIDWETGSWGPIDTPERSEKTLRQVAEARKRYGDRFLVAYYGAEKAGRDLDKPLGTVTTRERFAIVRGDQMRMLTVDEVRRAMGFPSGYLLPSVKKTAIHLLGNAVCPPVAAGILSQIKEAA